MKIIKLSNSLPENEALMFIELFKNEESTSDTLATGIVQVYQSHQSKWMLIHVGVLYLLFDQLKQCHYLKLYSPLDASLLWHQKIYKQFVYETPNTFFQMIEGDNAVFGLNFCEILEADEFYRNMNEHVLKTHLIPATNKKIFDCIKKMKLSLFSRWSLRELKARRKQRELRPEISHPINCKHLAHFDNDGNYEGIENDDIIEEIKKELKSHINLSTDKLNTPEIHDYVNWVACQLRPYSKTGIKYSQRPMLRPPAISWASDEDMKHYSMINPFYNEPINESSQKENIQKPQLFNAIALALAKRNIVHNYSDTDDDSSDDQWN